MNSRKFYCNMLACVALAAAAPAQTAAPADAPPASQPASISLPFTDDFESGEVNKKVWDVRTHGTATVKVVQDKVAHGKNALMVHYPAGAAQAYAFVTAKLPASLHDHFYGRAYIYISSMPAPHSVLLTAGTPGYPIANFLEIGMRRRQFQPSYQQNAAGVPRAEYTYLVPGEIPIGRWFCLEWEFNDKPDRIIMTIDGKPFADQSISHESLNSELVKGFSEFSIGFRAWGGANNMTKDVDVYYDDIAISDKPVGQLPAAP